MERDELYQLVDIILNHADRDELEVIRAALKRRDEAAEAQEGYGGMEISPKQLAEGTARTIAEQMSYSRDTIRNMVKNFAVDIIRKEAPDLSDEQVRELLHAWIPDPEGRTPSHDPGGSGKAQNRGGKAQSQGGANQNRGGTRDRVSPGSRGGAGLVDAGGRREEGQDEPRDFSAPASNSKVTPESGVDPDSGLPKDLLVTMIEQFISYSEGRMGLQEQAKLRREIPDWQEVYWKRFSAGIRDSLSLYLKGTIDHEDFWLDIYTRLEL